MDSPALSTAGWSAKDLALFSRAREAFVLGGARAVEALDDFEQSLEIRIEDCSAAFFAGSLRERLVTWRRKRAFKDFFFMRKPPGMRLRFFGRHMKGLKQQLFPFLDAERKRGVIRDYYLSVYDGETYQFGGEAGLALMHAHGSYDSVWALEVFRRGKLLSADPQILSLLAINDLFRKVVLDPFEGWDLWENMRLTGRVADEAMHAEDLERVREDAESQMPLLTATWYSPESLLRKLNARDRALMRSYFAENDAWEKKYRAIARAGSLMYGIRKILPFYVIFHWNRLALPFEAQVTLTSYMRLALNPKKTR